MVRARFAGIGMGYDGREGIFWQGMVWDMMVGNSMVWQEMVRDGRKWYGMVGKEQVDRELYVN